MLEPQLSAILVVDHMRPVPSRCALAQKLAACAKSLVQANAAMTVEFDDIEVILNKTFTTGNNAIKSAYAD